MGITPTISPLVQPVPIMGPVQPPLPESNQRNAPLNLVDPITRGKLKLRDPFKDKLLRLNTLERVQLSLRNAFVTLPHNIYQGLRGDSDYTFSDFLNVSKIPYYLGGAFLTASFAAGRAKADVVRQGMGVGMYYLGLMGANRLIDGLYKFRTGADLNWRYQKPNGDIEKALASADFPRVDLLEDSDYERMAKKMGIPNDIADQKQEVNDQLRKVISTSRADKLILGNLLAAFAAGYLARSDAWARFLGPYKGTKAAMMEGNVIERVKNTALSLWGHAERGVQEQVTGFTGELTRKQRLGFLGGIGTLTALILGHVWLTTRKDHYERAMPIMRNEIETHEQAAAPKPLLLQPLAPSPIFSTLMQNAPQNPGGRLS